jgi:hypothetical protein
MDGVVQGTASGDEVHIEKALVGLVRGHDVEIRFAGAGPVAARGDVSIVNGGCGPVATAGDLSIENGGCGPVLAAGNISITNGGTQGVISLGEATLGPRTFVGAVIAPRVTIQDGARVMMTTKQALAFAGVVGTVIGLAMLVRGGRNGRD